MTHPGRPKNIRSHYDTSGGEIRARVSSGQGEISLITPSTLKGPQSPGPLLTKLMYQSRGVKLKNKKSKNKTCGANSRGSD